MSEETDNCINFLRFHISSLESRIEQEKEAVRILRKENAILRAGLVLGLKDATGVAVINHLCKDKYWDLAIAVKRTVPERQRGALSHFKVETEDDKAIYAEWKEILDSGYSPEDLRRLSRKLLSMASKPVQEASSLLSSVGVLEDI